MKNKKNFVACILDFVVAALFIATVLWFYVGLSSESLFHIESSDSGERLGFGIGLIVIIPLFIIASAPLAVAAVFSLLTGFRLLLYKGEEFPTKSCVTCGIMKLVSVLTGGFMGLLAMGLPSGKLFGVVCIVSAVGALVSIVADCFIRKQKKVD